MVEMWNFVTGITQKVSAENSFSELWAKCGLKMRKYVLYLQKKFDKKYYI